MRFTFTTILALVICAISFTSATVLFSSQPPQGSTGLNPGNTCANVGCHSGNPLNNPGGSVVFNGLPSSYTPGTTYPISVTINHSSSNRTRWGFSMKAVGMNNNDVGTFSTTNPNVALNGTELSHNNAPSTSASNTFTFNNLSWTAPATPTPQEQIVVMYVAGNAANGSGNGGDFIYTTSASFPLQTTAVDNIIPEVDKWSASAQNGKVTIRLSLNRSSEISATVRTLNGAVVATKSKHKLLPGEQVVSFDTPGLQSGVYIVTVNNGKISSTKRIVL